MIPTFVLTMWLTGLLSGAIVGGAVYLGHEWYQRSWTWDEALRASVFAPDWGWNAPTLMFAGALLLALIAFMGGPMVKLGVKRSRRRGDDPQAGRRAPSSEERLTRSDGSELHVKTYGAETAPTVVFTHGWGLNSEAWVYAERAMAEQFRIVTWDEPGLGRSKRPSNRDYSLENLATALRDVLALKRVERVVLVGHSIGGMIILTLCRLFPELLRTKLAGIVLVHTTPTNPVRTTKGAAFYTAIEKPVLVPLMYLTIALSPAFSLLNWLSYRNGLAHLSQMSGGFGGTESWEQIEFVTRIMAQAPPSVLAYGMLGMMRYDATAMLPQIDVPTLIVAADRDETTKPEASDVMQRKIPGATKYLLTPARHLGYLEHHPDFLRVVQTFAQAMLTPGPGASSGPSID